MKALFLLCTTLCVGLATISAQDFIPLRPANKAYPFVVRMVQNDFPAGISTDYYLCRDILYIEQWHPFGDQREPSRRVWSRRLSGEERKDWSAYLERFPLSRLLSRYENPRVNDGLRLIFTFRTKSEEKVVTALNVEVPELMELLKRIFALLPKEVWNDGGPTRYFSDRQEIEPNKAPEPTPGAVTPRATEGASR